MGLAKQKQSIVDALDWGDGKVKPPFHQTIFGFGQGQRKLCQRSPLVKSPPAGRNSQSTDMTCTQKDMKIAEDRPPHDMELWEVGRHLTAPPPPPLPSDIKYAKRWVWTKNLICSTPPPSFKNDAPPGWVWGYLVLFLLSWRAGIDCQLNLAESKKQWHLPFRGFPWGTPKIKKTKNASVSGFLHIDS
jgi:hypothetical protein